MRFGQKRRIDFTVPVKRLASNGIRVVMINVPPHVMSYLESFYEYDGIKVMFISEGWKEIDEKYFLELKTSEGLVYTMSPVFIT